MARPKTPHPRTQRPSGGRSSSTRPAPVSAARRAVVEEWLRVVPEAAGPDAATQGGSARLPDAGDQRRFTSLGAQDRALAERLFRGVLQNLRLLDWLIDREGLFKRDRTAPPIIWLLRLAAFQKIFLDASPDYAIGQQTVEQARALGGPGAARFANAVVRRLLERLPESEDELGRRLASAGSIPSAVRYSVPDDVADRLGAGYGSESIASVLEGYNHPSEIWLRANTLRVGAEQLMCQLEAEGVRCEAAPGAGGALRWIRPSRTPWESESWARGELTVQDLGAQLAVRLLAPRAGEAVLDMCAAPGGKSGQIWEALGGRGSLSAWEIDADRRRLLVESLIRLYGPGHAIEILDSPPGGGSGAGGPAGDDVEARFDAVLVDAPCLGLGLLRRHPEVRWAGRLRTLSAMQAVQRDLLESASRQVRDDGRLLWVTCSPIVEENETIISDFLERHSEFRMLDLKGLDNIELPEWAEVTGGIVRTRPDRASIDGFAMALLGR